MTTPVTAAGTAVQRPLARLSSAMSRCGVEGAAYGRCVVSQVDDIGKDGCVREFEAFKACVSRGLGGRRW
ncbi:hypothetical protein PYCC9005_005519 [Savitreella phatthalungensis]